VAWSELLNSFGKFKAEQVQLSQLGDLNGKAFQVMDKAGWK
jgi:iron(III) transport system substrate-binding protein